MLLVILGAGASHDCVFGRNLQGDDQEFEPPLANGLFADRLFIRTALAQYPNLVDLANELRGDLQSPPPKGLEKLLDGYVERATSATAPLDVRVRRWRQLVDLRAYLDQVVSVSASRWADLYSHTTHFATLVAMIERETDPGDEVTFVTFNYDLLLESALTRILGMPFNKLPEYIAGPFAVIKLHGSVGWGRAIDIMAATHDEAQVRQLLSERLAAGDPTVLSDTFDRWMGPRGAGHNWVPAIAVPLTTKDEFECPAEHVALLDQRLPKVRRVLAIGWKGAESSFGRMLATRLPKGVAFDIVSGSSPTKTVAELSSTQKVDADYRVMTGGFSFFASQCAALGRLPLHLDFAEP